MSQDPVVMALRAALQAQDGVELRVALGTRLLDLGQAAEALSEFEAAIALEPRHVAALEAAARAAHAAGDSAKAYAYRLASDAAAGAPAAPKVQGPQPPPTAANPPAPAQASAAGRAHSDGRARSLGDSKAPAKLRLVTEESVLEHEVADRVTFADIGGLDDVKQRLTRSFLLPLQKPELFAKFGKSLRGGLLLYGPPGCGKTFIARALAGEIGARFFSVALSDVLDMWHGESERKLHEIFANARRLAPSVVFFDEIDALGQRRTNLAHSAGRNLVNQLLSEMDGVEAKNRDLFVLGATNHPWDLDPALRRPGRFDRMQFVPAPDAGAREHILQLKLHERPHAEGIDVALLAQRTEGFSGADLQALIDAATERAFELTADSGTEHTIDLALLQLALKDMKPSTRPWLETARNYAVYANEGGSYDELLAYLKSVGLA